MEIVEALHRRADEVEPHVGAFAHQFRKQALNSAAEADSNRHRAAERPLLGLPITIKENIDTQGVPSTLGLRARQHLVAGADAVTVRLLKEAGAVIVGKTNVPQTLLAPMETTNAIFGTTHNPWRHGHGPGGSSGGEAAAIASGMSVCGVGTDIGGSIRVPASFCGIVGLKPTAGFWSNHGSQTAIAGQEFVRAQMGPLARDVNDLITLVRAIPTPQHATLDSFVPPVPMADPDEIDVEQLRVGFYEDDGFLLPAASVRRAVREAAKLLEGSGVEVVRFAPPNVDELLYLYFRGLSSDGAETLDRLLDGEAFIQPLRTLGRIARMPKRARAGLATALNLMGEDRVSRLLEAIGEKRVVDLFSLTARRNALMRDEQSAWERAGIDVVLAPTYVTPACRHGSSHDFTIGFVNLARYSLLNRPAGSVPITMVRPDETTRSSVRDRVEKRAAQIESQSDGLPVGVQVVGAPWQEAKVLAVMKRLHQLARQGDFYPSTPVDPKPG